MGDPAVALRPVSRAFYARPSTVVARDLLGRLLVRSVDGVTLVARIVECEAYQEDDPASHSFRPATKRTEVMFGPAGRLYVYFSYGMHFCMNVVTGRAGEGSAVLLRAAEPVEGLAGMQSRRGVTDPRLLCSGPGRLTQAFGIDRLCNGLDLLTGRDLFLAPGQPVPDELVAVGPRVGISVAAERPWRFVEAGSPFLSRPGAPPGAASRRGARGRRG